MSVPFSGVFHHVGVAVAQIESAAQRFREVFGAIPDSPVYHDALQGVYIQFLKLGDSRIELLASASSDSPVNAMLRRGISVYHVCFETDDFDKRLEVWVKSGAQLVSPPKPAVAFDQRRVAFVMCLGLIVELVESPSTAG